MTIGRGIAQLTEANTGETPFSDLIEKSADWSTLTELNAPSALEPILPDEDRPSEQSSSEGIDDSAATSEAE